MKKRSAEILRRLLDAPTHTISLDTIFEDYRISEKTLRSDVQSISSFIQVPDGDVVVLAGGYLALASGVDGVAIGELLDEMDLYEYKLSSEERKVYIIVMLVMNQGNPCSMQSLADEMYVTRNTVINDCRLVGDWLAARGVEMLSRGKLGVSADIDGDFRNALLIDVFADLFRQRRHRHDFFSRFIAQMLGYRYSADSIIALMRAFQNNRNTIITREAECEIAACLVVLLNSLGRADGDGVYLPKWGGSQDFVDDMVCFVSTGLRPPCDLDPSAIDRIRQAILNRDLLPQIKGMNDFDLYCAISHFLLLVAADLSVDIQNDELLIESLLSHVKSMVERSSDVFEVNVSQPSGVMVGMVEHAALPHFHVLESYLHRPMNRSMRSSVIIHICAALYRAQDAFPATRVVIACPGSMATSAYLEAQVRNYFRFEVVETNTEFKLDRARLLDRGVELVISSVPIEGLPIPVIQVSPMLTVEDVNRIQAQAFQLRRGSRVIPSTAGKTTFARLQSIYESGSSKKITYLDLKISSILDSMIRSEDFAASYSPLISMLSGDHIRIEDGEMSWRLAIELSAESLLHDGSIAPSCVRRAIENVEDYGSYIVVNDGIALAHGGRDDGVFRDGLGLLVSREGVLFDTGERVHLLFFFCQQSETDYLGLFKEIIRLGNEPGDMNRLLMADTPEEVQRILLELLTSYVESPDGRLDED